MPEEIRLWRISKSDSLEQVPGSELDFEQRLEKWLTADISILSGELLVIGRQVPTAFGGVIDLLCIDADGNLVVVELKRNKTPRDITAQVIDYATWVKTLTFEEIAEISASSLGKGRLEEAFRQRFDRDLPDSVNENHSLLVVGSAIDDSSRRIIEYLAETYGVPLNAASFQYFKDNSGEFLARAFLIEPEVAPRPGESRRSTVTIDGLLGSLTDVQLRNAVGKLIEMTQGMGFVIERGSVGLSIRRRVTGRSTPVSVAWYFPPRALGWYNLTDLTLGYETQPSVQISNQVRTELESFVQQARRIDGAESADRKGLACVRIPPHVLVRGLDALGEVLAGVARSLDAINDAQAR